MVLPDEPTSLGGDAFRFAHILMRDAAYAALLKTHRAELHERFADWIEQATADRTSEYGEILGYHLEQAYLISAELGPPDEHAVRLASRGGAVLSAAGSRALAREDIPAAVTLL